MLNLLRPLYQEKKNEFLVFYDPTFFGNMLVSRYANPHLQQTAFNVTNSALCRRDLVRFQGETQEGLIPCAFDEENDRVTCFPTYVQIHDSVFGEAANVYRQFNLPAHLFQIDFDVKGYEDK